jgi:hypothetical protein
MESKVVNVKVAFIRKCGYKNLKEWIEDTEKNVYIGRKGIVFIDGERYPKCDSFFKNPFKIDKKCADKDKSKDDVIIKYKKYIEDKLINDYENVIHELKKLKGKKLGCWCKGEGNGKCHGDILIELLKKYT